ncbi:MAG: 16S rRNA (cytosine(1402)-N(4))-methyltransferase RsmH [Mariprofundaceae bacterium]|nr:16S rRNA (cytosine(1402)-N(4))-methyltransferase RsmH [Mariprofundaceae bacterium]
MTQKNHVPVLLSDYINGLMTDPDGHYIDATFGRGGHSQALLDKLSPKAHLSAFDRDPEAIEVGQKLEKEDARFSIYHTAFSGLASVLDENNIQQVTGIGFDLGTSSPQLDTAARGFSFRQEGPLDMRMDHQNSKSLEDKLERVSETELVRVIREYGDERYAGRIAKAILKAKHDDKLHNTTDLENCVYHAIPKRSRFGNSHPATRTFQALRIWVNDEYQELETALLAAIDALATGGRLVFISFHSGEDRRVRDLIEKEINPCTCPRDFPMCVCHRKARMRWIQKKPIRASETEIEENPRSRSSLLRIAEKV